MDLKSYKSGFFGLGDAVELKLTEQVCAYGVCSCNCVDKTFNE